MAPFLPRVGRASRCRGWPKVVQALGAPLSECRSHDLPRAMPLNKSACQWRWACECWSAWHNIEGWGGDGFYATLPQQETRKKPVVPLYISPEIHWPLEENIWLLQPFPSRWLGGRVRDPPVSHLIMWRLVEWVFDPVNLSGGDRRGNKWGWGRRDGPWPCGRWRPRAGHWDHKRLFQ